MSTPIDLHSLLLPDDWTDAQIEAEARRIFFKDLVPNPPVTPACAWLEKKGLIISNSEGAFKKVFGKTEGWGGYSHKKTGTLCRERMRRAPWIRPVLEMRVAKTKVYVNLHAMGPRDYHSFKRPKRNRIFVTTGADLLYFISLVHTEHGLALATAFEPDGPWLRQKLKENGTSPLGPPNP